MKQTKTNTGSSGFMFLSYHS